MIWVNQGCLYLQKNMKYFLYTRKSSESEDRQVQSIGDQKKRILELAGDLELRVVRRFEESKSAKAPNKRPVFEDMMNRIENGEADAILCWHFNRLSRNPIDSARLQWMLQQGIIKEIRTIDRVYKPEDNAILLSVDSGSANQFILDLSKGTKRGIRGKLERGGLPRYAPPGYLNDRLEKTIVPDPDRFDLVRKMWDMMLTGKYNAYKITDFARKELKFRTRKTKKTGGKPLSSSMVYRMFKNPFYYGKMLHCGELYDGNHKPMVTEEEFNVVQDIISGKSRKRRRKHNFPFTGIIVCGNCGCLVTAEKKQKHIKSTGKTNTYVYYRCTRRKQGIKCMEPVIKGEELEEQIMEILGKYTISPEFKDWALGVIEEGHEKEVKDRSKVTKNFRKQQTDLESQLDNLTTMRLRELVTDEEYLEKKEKLQEELGSVRTRVGELDNRLDNWWKKVDKAFDFAVTAREKFIKGDEDVKRLILTAVGQNFKLKGRKLHLEPVEWLEFVSNQEKSIEKEFVRLEPNKKGLTKPQMYEFIDRNPHWGGQRELNPCCRYHKPT